MGRRAITPFKSGIYSITSPSGKLYIGSATHFQKRWNKHKMDLRNGSHHNRPLIQAFNKYGMEGLVFSVIIYCDIKDLIFYEQLLMDGIKPAYNTAKLAGSSLGYRFTDEQKAKISASNTGIKRTQETKNKISESLKGRVVSEDTKDKMRGAENPAKRDEVRLKLSEGSYNRSPEARERHRLAVVAANKRRKNEQV